MDSRTLAELRHILRPISTRVANMIARATVQLVNDGKKLQLVQIGALEGEAIDDAEHFQPFGFASVPLAGAEGVAVFPNGDRGHPLVVVVSDRRYRPTGSEPGEVTVYNHTGAKITITKDGDIEVTPAPGREVLVRTEGGDVDRLVKRSEFLDHTHLTAGTGSPVGPTSLAAPADPNPFPGTQVLKAE